IKKYLNKEKKNILRWRRDLHQIAEIGFLEYETTAYLIDRLKEFNLETFIGQEVMNPNDRLGLPSKEEIVDHEKKLSEKGFDWKMYKSLRGGMTGVIARCNTGNEGPHLAFRFDIDALPIHEITDQKHRPTKEQFRSQNDGWMHACGHDGHMTIWLAIAQYVSQNQHRLKGTFTFLFQPAEEGTRGARALVSNGWLQSVDELYAAHIGMTDRLTTGEVAICAEGFLAATKIDVTFTGTSSHAALTPEKGDNVMLAVANTILNSYAISRHSEGTSRVNVGVVRAGEGRNIIPSNAQLEIEVRGENKNVSDYMMDKIKRIVKHSAAMANVQYTFEIVGFATALKNSESLAQEILHTIRPGTFLKSIYLKEQTSGSEDASLLIDAVNQQGGRGIYSLIGSELAAPHHHPAFDFDEQSLFTGIEYFLQIIERKRG
ncbi:MAG TPA: amidohydrolase, partial [Pseudobacillus sp.]